MLGLRRLAPLSGLLFALACSSASSPDAPAKPAPPVWDGAPMTVPIYDGRAATVKVDIRTKDPSKLTVTAAADGVVTELVAADPRSDAAVWHGTLTIRPGYALPSGAGPSVSVELTDADGQHVTQPISLDVHKLGWQKRVAWDPGKGPQTREHGAFFYDADANAAYLFQGSGYSPQLQPIADNWRLDIAAGAWAPWTATGDVPVAGGSRRVAQIPGTGRSLSKL